MVPYTVLRIRAKVTCSNQKHRLFIEEIESGELQIERNGILICRMRPVFVQKVRGSQTAIVGGYDVWENKLAPAKALRKVHELLLRYRYYLDLEFNKLELQLVGKDSPLVPASASL